MKIYHNIMIFMASASLSLTAVAVETGTQASFHIAPLQVSVIEPSSTHTTVNLTSKPINDNSNSELNSLVLTKPIALPHSLNNKQLIKLEHALALYESLSQQGDWERIPNGKNISFGDAHPHVTIVRQKLSLLGDHPPLECEDKTDPLFDVELHDALVRFQIRHGGKPDGILGPNTRYHLNIKPYQRVEQLRVNIARIKEFSPNTDRFIQVNIPEYQLHLYEHNQQILSMKTIVGKKKRKTPVFDSVIDRIVINPSWHVPKSIAYKDILPALQENPDHLNKLNLKVVTGWGEHKKFIATEDIDYEKLYVGKNYQRFWEAPSQNNTLGSVKFLTNGPYSIYLHDTSAKRLFKESNRAYSSGCIRLEHPRKLADELMRMTRGWNSNKLDPIFKQSKTKQYNLQDPIPLHVTYWTAWVDSQGLTHFRKDIYKRDKYELSQLK